MRSLIRLLRDSRGASTIENALFLGLAAIVLSSGLSSVGGKLNGAFDKAGQAMAATPPKPSAAPTRAIAATRTPDGRYILVEDTQDGFLQNHQ